MPPHLEKWEAVMDDDIESENEIDFGGDGGMGPAVGSCCRWSTQRHGSPDEWMHFSSKTAYSFLHLCQAKNKRPPPGSNDMRKEGMTGQTGLSMAQKNSQGAPQCFVA